ncbi:Myomegalin [Merluccius polli]|uniref:Myomegalin n=1 Tax=Merluccius polli TaxID=89951 RepID=A0AA47MBU6_MERPO|nr:Myomegalin [Merluccius polli]
MDWTSPPSDAWCEPGTASDVAVKVEALPKTTGHMTDLCSDEADNSPHLQLHTLKEFEQHLNDLKKENFSLKLRIYFLEERIQQKYEESCEDVYRTNIELKVEVESLKQELQEKQQLLDKALETAESLTNHNEAELQRRCQERQQEINDMQEVLETKIQLLQEEAQLARSEAERMASLAGSHSLASPLSPDTPMEDSPEDERPPSTLPQSNTNKDRLIEQLMTELRSKEGLVAELSGEKTVLTERVEELEAQVEELSSSLLQKEKDVEFYQEELGQERLRIEQEMQMKETCRICARELCGNQRRWIFHPAAKLNLQVLLSHALGRELTRDGRGEFACSKCTFMLARMYRFDTVIARVEALSIERLHRLLTEKHRLRQCIGGLYRKTNGDEGGGGGAASDPFDGVVDMTGLSHAKYCALLQDDLVYSLYESWADDGMDCPQNHQHHHPHPHHHSQCPAALGSEASAAAGSHPYTPKTRCRGCSRWRVADSDYEAVCKVPRKLARSISCGPSTRYSASVVGGGSATRGGGGGVTSRNDEEEEGSEEPVSSPTLVPGSRERSRTSDSERTLAGGASSRCSLGSLEPSEEYGQQTPGREGDGSALGVPRDSPDERIPDSLSKEHPGAPLGLAPSASGLSLALCVLHNCAPYRPVQSPKGCRLPVLLRQSPSDGGTRMDLLESPYGATNGELDIQYHMAELEAPLIRLGVGTDSGVDLAEMDDLWEDVYKEYPTPRPHQDSYMMNKLKCFNLHILWVLQSLVEEQQSQLNQYECAAGQCVSELHKAQLQVQSLQAKIHEGEANNTKLQEKLNEMECELRSIRQAAQFQERTIQGLTDSIDTKDGEAQDLYQLIEGQNATLCKLREMAHRNQLTQAKTPEGTSEAQAMAHLQGELVRAQSSLFSLGLELEASQRSLRHSQREGEDLARFKERLHSDLQVALQHRDVTEKHNQDLHRGLQRMRAELREKEAALKESEAEKHTAALDRDRSLNQVQHSLQEKDRQLQEYSEMLESTEASKPRDALLEKLRERIKERDRALERSIDEKFRCLEEREGQVSRLQLGLREKERDLDRLRCILSNNEETITSLDSLVRGKDLELGRAAEAYRSLQWLQQQSQETEGKAVGERDTAISQLQTALQARSQEAQELRASLLARVQAGPSEVVEELKSRLALKDKLFQELLSDRSHQSKQHQVQLQDLLNTISSKDQYLQDCSDRLSQVIGERTSQMQELHRQLATRDRELCELRRESEREMGGETERLQSLLKDKDAFIKELMQGQEEAMESTSKEGEAEMRAVQEELQLVLKKENEAQKEISALQVALGEAQQQAHEAMSLDSTGHHRVLQQLQSEYYKLNDALRTEKGLYQSLTHTHSRGDSSSEKTQALHTELDSVQALRGQLEEILARTRSMALALERAAETRSDFGELSTEDEEEEGDDEEGSTDEFSDSIEDDDVKVTAKSLGSAQGALTAAGPHHLLRGALPQETEVHSQQVQRLEEEKKTLEGELQTIHSQLEKDGYSSLAQMRSTLLGLQQEIQALRGSPEAAGAGAIAGSPCWSPQGSDEQDEEDMEDDDEEEEEEEEEGEEEEEEPQSTAGECGALSVRRTGGRGETQPPRPHSLDLETLLSHHQPSQQGKEGKAAGGLRGKEVGGRSILELVEEGLREQAAGLRSDLSHSRQENHELQERLMVSEATVQAQAEQLNDYRELLTETSVQQANKQVQVDLQDLGYETCGRSENEAEREDASSPEFDDLEMCTSLSHHTDYEVGAGGGGWYAGDHHSGGGGEDDDDDEDDGDDGGGGGGYEDLEEEEEQGKGSLRHLVQDLRAQLTRCHKVIRGLQMRVRSLSSTSDYASSLERTPRKVNWAFEASPAHSGVEDDEGWMSDTLASRSKPKPSRELRELVSRVASLEAQLKSSRLEGKGLVGEEGKCATWPGKYNTLIQAQARELSHLRQRMREGRGVCHILTQHLGDTTKGFEELLRANDIDYYMGQSFREQLAQSTSLAQRVATKISGRDRAEGHDDKTGHELLALRLSKELQQKDKIIESLHTKLQRRPETPSSCHALSETSDQTDRTSLVSDECRTNEDLELCSELDTSEYQEQHRQEPALGSQRGVCPSLPPPHGLKSCNSCPNMLSSHPLGFVSQPARALPTGPVSSSLPGPLSPDFWGQRFTFDPRPRAVSVNAVRQELDIMYRQMHGQHQGFGASLSPLPPLGAHERHTLASYSPHSHHTFQPYQLGSVPECHSLKSDSGLLMGGALWDTENVVQPMQTGYAGTAAYHADNSHAGVDLIEEHLREVRCLRQRLEESIRTNERLRQQLEEKLASTSREGGKPNTHLALTQLLTLHYPLPSRGFAFYQATIVKKEFVGRPLTSTSRDWTLSPSYTCEEVVQLREAVQAGHGRLKQAEHEAEQWKEELRRLQTHSQEQSVQIHTMRQERQAAQENNNRLQHEGSLLQQQLCESRELSALPAECTTASCGSTKAHQGFLSEVPGLPLELGELLGEVRSLRAQLQSSVQESSALKQLELHKQLEQKLGLGSPRTPSLPQRDNFYRRQLLHDPAPSPPVRDIGLFNCGSPYGPYSDLDDGHSTANAPLPLLEEPFDSHSDLEGDAPDGSFANRNGRHAIGHVDDFSALQQQVLEGRSLVQRIETALQACLSQPLLPGNQEQSNDLVLDYSCIKSLLSNTKTLRQILDEALSLLKMFWRAALPSNDRSPLNLKKEQSMQEEILSLRLRMSEQEEVLQGTVQRLRSTNRTKENMEHFIVNQLSRTRDVIKKARTNLEKNEQRLSSLSSASSTPSAAEDPRPVARAKRNDWSFLKTSGASGVAVATTNQRPAARKRSSQCLLETLTC